jgi:hypothetical protein
MNNDSVYVVNVPGETHMDVQLEVACTLDNAMEALGLPLQQGFVRMEARGDYFDEANNETVIMQPDVVIIADGQTVAVFEIEITHRSVPESRLHAQSIFTGNENVIIVAVLKVHTPRRTDRSFAAEFVAWRRGDDGIIRCLPDCVHDFGTGVSDPRAINNWRLVRQNVAVVVPQDVQFIQPERRAAGEQRGPLVLPVVDALRVALNGVYDTDAEVEDCSIDLTTIVSLVEQALPERP